MERVANFLKSLYGLITALTLLVSGFAALYIVVKTDLLSNTVEAVEKGASYENPYKVEGVSAETLKSDSIDELSPAMINLARRYSFEEVKTRVLTGLLEPIVGKGEVRVAVDANLDKAGNVKRLSIAVMLNNIYTVNEWGEREFRARSQAEMELILAAVSAATGFDRARGDRIEILNVQFATPVEDCIPTLVKDC